MFCKYFNHDCTNRTQEIQYILYVQLYVMLVYYVRQVINLSCNCKREKATNYVALSPQIRNMLKCSSCKRKIRYLVMIPTFVRSLIFLLFQVPHSKYVRLAKDNILRALIKELRSNSFLSIAASCNYKKVLVRFFYFLLSCNIQTFSSDAISLRSRIFLRPRISLKGFPNVQTVARLTYN